MKVPPQTDLVPPVEASPSAPARAVSFHDNEVPAFVEAELERLYQCVMSTLARLDASGAAAGMSTYVVREYGEVTTLFLFRVEGRRVVVCNEQIVLGRSEINRFADAVFARYPQVALVSFHAVDAPSRGIRYPMQRCACLADVRLALPSATDLYLDSLGPATRVALRRYRTQLQCDHPSFRFEVYDGDEASEAQVRSIVALRRQRMREKGQPVIDDEAALQRLLGVVRKYGVVCVATVDGCICAGVICTRVGGSYQLVVLAHDSRFGQYRLGKLCCCYAICHAIEQGGRQFVFGWDRQECRLRIPGERKELYEVEVYRSRRWMLAYCMRVARIALAAAARRVGQRVAGAEGGGGRVARLLAASTRFIRRAQGTLRRLTGA
jgi:hypothetical protein